MNSVIICNILAVLLLNMASPALANVLIKPAAGKEDHAVAITLNAPAELNAQTQAEILAKREKYLQQWHSLYAGKYQPSPVVFQNLEDHKNWWGMHGAFVWGQGQRSIEGAAEESRFILNPLLLVGVNSATVDIWKTDRISKNDLDDPNFPFCWEPTSLSFFPEMSLAQVVYSVSKFNKEIKARENKLRFNPDLVRLNRFGLVAYNARDFGFQYIYADIAKSINIVNTNGCNSPVLIKQFIHCGNSANYPGGCNNMSPAMPEIDRFAITTLPARACVYLWKNQPVSIADKPDFTFYIDFR
jgi:hypothetical protein